MGSKARNHTRAGWGLSKWEEEMERVNVDTAPWEVCPELLTENKRNKNWEGDVGREGNSLDKQLRVIKERTDLEQVKNIMNGVGRKTDFH